MDQKTKWFRMGTQNVDKPELGFEYEVLIYDDIECKVEKWNDEVELEQQDRLPLSETEKDAN